MTSFSRGDLSGMFGGLSTGPAISVTPKTMLQSLTGGVKTTSAAPVRSFMVNPNAASAAANVQPARAAMAAVGQQAGADRAAIAKTIRSAQNEVTTATRAVGADPAAVFPDTRMAAGGEGAIAITAVAGKMIQGAGSLVTALNTAPDIDGMIGDAKSGGADKAAILAQVQERLAASSAPPVDTRVSSSMPIFTTAGAEPAGGSGMDWKAFFDQGNDLKTLMSLDADNPNPDVVPEIKMVNSISSGVDAVTSSLNKVDDDTIKDGRDNAQEDVGSGWDPNDRMRAGIWASNMTIGDQDNFGGLKVSSSTAAAVNTAELNAKLRQSGSSVAAPAPRNVNAMAMNA